MQLGCLISAWHRHSLGYYLNNSCALGILIELIKDASIGDRCFANAFVAHKDDLKVIVRWILHLVHCLLSVLAAILVLELVALILVHHFHSLSFLD